MKKIVFLTGTRADYGKIKSLMKKVVNENDLELNIFVTGMHMLSKYGFTVNEIVKDNFENIYSFINQKPNQSMDLTLSNTIIGFSNYVTEIQPELIVVHGDRVEALAGAIVGATNNIKVAHIEGGEVSGTIDESIRHAITKFSHIHLVSNEESKKRVMQLGEHPDSIHVIGSPDIDIMYMNNLPTLEMVKKRYNIEFEEYSIVLFHPVTTELNSLERQVTNLVSALIDSNKKYILIYPNNDEGTQIILSAYEKLEKNENFKVFPSLRFEYFVSLLKSARAIIGNSSAGIREAGVFGIPAVNIGTRQNGRYDVLTNLNIRTVDYSYDEIFNALRELKNYRTYVELIHGNGNSDERFIELLKSKNFWEINIQKKFKDLEAVKGG